MKHDFPQRSAGSPVVLVFLKAPRAGQVKTRLARDIGGEAAVQLYRGWGASAVNAVPADWQVEVHYAPRRARAEMQTWLGSRPAYFAQSPGDLGQRLQVAVASAFHRGAAEVMVIGGDCPGLGRSDLFAAHAALAEADVVLGPALDGGYYLIAVRKCAPQLFRDIPWSTLQVLPATLQRIAAAGLSFRLLAPKEDIDDLAALERYREARAE